MRYLSVCSGIEAASVAWHHLGWTPVAFSEIEPFPAAVLAHHFPNVPNYGDMTKHKEWPLGPGSIDLLVGGTPCQSFSVAGLRKGISDPRGGLMLTYLEIAQRLRPRWIVWENVPGVLSSNGGRDFGTFLGALGELGYGFAYRVLDAQYVRVGRWPRAVPQRRRRVFVVGCLGDGAAAAQILALEEGLRRHIEAQSKKGKGSAPDAEGGARGGCWWDGGQVSQTLDAVLQPTAGTLGNRGLRSHTELDGHGAYIPVAQPVPYDLFQITAPVNRQNRKPGDPCHTLARDNAAHAAIAIGTDCYNGAITGDVAATMGTPGSSVNASGPTVMAFQLAGDRSDPTVSVSDAAFCLPANSMSDRGQAVAFTVGNAARGQGPSPSTEVFPTLKSGGGRGTDDQWPSVMTAMTVRRLTPVECERLQGFPDNWTAIPWRGKTADQCPDGPRYKALGNSMACNCMAWIGERIAAAEEHQ